MTSASLPTPPSALGSGYALILLLLRRRYVVVRLAMVGFLVGVAVALLAPARYSVSASVMSQGAGGPQNLGGLAAQFGVNLPAGEASLSPFFYVDLARSRGILGDVAVSAFTVSGPAPRKGNLAQVLGLPAADSLQQRDVGIRWLLDAVGARAEPKTGVVTVSVVAPDPALALQLGRRIIDLLDAFNRETRQSRGMAERRFTEQRLKAAQQELREAEDRLEGFVGRNRDISNAPGVSMQLERMTRTVGMRRDVVTSLLTSYEKARIDEVRDTPVLTVVQQPEAPLRRDPRGTVKKSATGLFLGASFGVALVMLGLLRPGAGAMNESVEELTAQLHAARMELASPGRFLLALFGRRT